MRFFSSACSLFVFSYIFLSFISCAHQKKVKELSDLTKELHNISLIADRIDSLEKLAYVDLQLFKSLTAIRKKLDPKDITARRLGRYINDFQEGKGRATGWSKKDARKIAENPISAFRLIRRYVDDLQSELKLDLEKFDGIPKKAIFPRSNYPIEADFHIVAAGILMIQDFYNLSASDLSKGRVNGIKTGARLNSDHCLEIGRTAKGGFYYAQAIDWLTLALRKAKKSGRLHNYETIIQEMQSAEDAHDAEIKKQSSNHYLYLFTEPVNDYLHKFYQWQEVKGQTLPRPTKPRTRHDVLFENLRQNPTSKPSNSTFLNFEVRLRAVCKGHNFQTEEAKSRLFCWYEHRKHPRLLIGPLKMEFLNHAPDIVRVYEAVGPKAIKNVLALSRVKKFMRKDSESVDAVGTAYSEKGFGVFTFVWDGVPQNQGQGQGQTQGQGQDQSQGLDQSQGQGQGQGQTQGQGQDQSQGLDQSQGQGRGQGQTQRQGQSQGQGQCHGQSQGQGQGKGQSQGKSQGQGQGKGQSQSQGQDQGHRVGDAFIVNETLLSIPRVVEAVSGLEVAEDKKWSRGLFIKPYNFGVVGFPHFDVPKIATAIFYFTNTEGGGYTAFPRLGMAIRPIEGSFVFWFNEFRSRKPDKMLKHSPCPVYMGKKIIASKWILTNEQSQNVTCSPQKRERFKILVNGKSIY